MDHYTLYFGLFLGIALLCAVGWRRRAGAAKEETMLLANRDLGFFALMATLVMTEINTSTLTAFASMGYSCGIWALMLPLIFLFGLLFYALVVAKKWRLTAALSVAELFTRCYGTGIGKAASACLICASLGFSATYIRSITLILSPLAPALPLWSVSLGVVLLTLLITMPRGLVSIVETNVATFWIVLALAIYGVVFGLADGGIPRQSAPLAKGMQILPPLELGALIILTMFTYISAPWYGQKIFAARTKETALRGALAAAIAVFTIYIAAILGGINLSGAPLGNPDLSLAQLLMLLPKTLRGVSYALVFAVTATTLGSVWSAISSMVVADFLKGAYSKNSHRATRIASIAAALSLFLSIVFIDEIFPKLILANIPAFALSFALLAAFYWPRVSRTGAATSIGVGFAWGIFTYLYFGEEGRYILYWVFGGLPLIFGSGAAASLLWPRFIPQPQCAR